MTELYHGIKSSSNFCYSRIKLLQKSLASFCFSIYIMNVMKISAFKNSNLPFISYLFYVIYGIYRILISFIKVVFVARLICPL